MKIFCYANVVMINWLKNYIIFSLIDLGSVTGGIKSIENLKYNLITYHKTTPVIIISNQQP